MIHKYAKIFCWKNVSSFCSAKATHIFSAKNIRILYIESTKTVNEMTLNELVKLTTLWITGPWRLKNIPANSENPDQTCTCNFLLLAHVKGKVWKISTMYSLLNHPRELNSVYTVNFTGSNSVGSNATFGSNRLSSLGQIHSHFN